MKERPILFRGEMVRAILAGTKTQTRRIVKPQPIGGDKITDEYGQWMAGRLRDSENSFLPIKCPFERGMNLWVRETFRHFGNKFSNGKSFALVTYKQDGGSKEIEFENPPVEKWWNTGKAPWKPSIYMPRKFSRITLEIESVRVERLQEISEADVKAEGIAVKFHNSGDFGIPNPCATGWIDLPNGRRAHTTATGCYALLWESINGKGSWAANPFVWVITFQKI